MLISIFQLPNMRKMSFLVFILCILISFKNQNAETKKGSSSSPGTVKWSSSSWDSFPSIFLAPLSSSSSHFIMEDERFQEEEEEEGGGNLSRSLEEEGGNLNRSLEYDFYRDSCPQAEKIIREIVHDLYNSRSSVAPALLRLVFHDCFIEGCDASVLLDAAEGIESEKDSPPNQSLKGFDIIDIIKSEIEKVCPGVVSCADIVVLAAREGVVQAGGPFYPLFTGRRDSTNSFRDMATYDLPSPRADLSETLASFASRGFDERETVSLLGAHSIGVVHCKFFQNRLYNFGGTNNPDPSLDTGFLNLMRSRCNNRTITAAASPHSHTSLSSSAAPSASFDGSESPKPPSNSDASSPSLSSEAPQRKCSVSSSAAPSPSFKIPVSSLWLSSSAPSSFFYGQQLSLPEEPGMDMAYEGPSVDFGTVYYRSLLQGRGILYADQQLTAGEETRIWVRAYASDASLFRRDFSLAMMKLSDLRVLTGSMGQVRLNCSKVA